MKDKIEQLKFSAVIGILIQVVVFTLFIFWNGITQSTFVMIFLLVFETAILFYIISTYERDLNKQIVNLKEIVGTETYDAFLFGNIGLVVYDEDYKVIWMSDYFKSVKVNAKDMKVTEWLPEIIPLFNGDVDVIDVEYEDFVFNVVRNSEARLLYFKDITTEYRVIEKYTNDAPVMGLIHLDNYLEYTQYEEESRVYFVDSIVKQNLLNWASENDIFIRRLRNDRYLVLLNHEVFEEISKTNFSIMHKIRREAQNNDLALSLSMGFALGTSEFTALEELSNDLLELAQSRGGDQVAVRVMNEEIRYYGGNTQSRERRSKARVRAISQSVRELVDASDKVILVFHKNMDFDCLGSGLILSKMIKDQKKDVYLVTESGGIESKLLSSLKVNGSILEKDHKFIDEKEALNLLTYNTLVVLLDHHNDTVSNGADVIEQANKVVIIDHHRRTTDYNFQPVLAYIESSASSATEMVTEMLQYQEKRVAITPLEATYAYTGLIVDTNGFINRVGSRTFEAASILQKFGADVRYANELLDDSFDDIQKKNKIFENVVRKVDEGVMYAPVFDGTIIPRGLISSAADELLSVQDIKAVFVVSAISNDRVGISARSRGEFNVQKIMEKLGGGGHFNAAAVQKENMSIEALVAQLETVVEAYLEEVYNDESNIVG